MQRIEAFLAEEEVPEWASSIKMSPAMRASAPVKVGFEDAAFEWDVAPKDVPSRFRLGPLSVKFPAGRLTLVSGATGSGKSALLSALLGGMCWMQPHLSRADGACVHRNALYLGRGSSQQGGTSGGLLCAESM